MNPFIILKITEDLDRLHLCVFNLSIFTVLKIKNEIFKKYVLIHIKIINLIHVNITHFYEIQLYALKYKF